MKFPKGMLVRRSNKKTALALKKRIGVGVIVGVIGVISIMAFTNMVRVSPHAEAATTFTFAVANDFDTNKWQAGAVSTMSAMGQSSAVFTFLNGDLAQAQPPGAAAFCTDIQNNVNKPTFVVGGNHDTEDGGPGYSIGDYTTAGCVMPTTTGAISAFQPGSYLQDYYVDYPATSPKLRIIAISPELLFGGSYYDYSSGSARYNWVSNAIDAAKANGEWVVLAFHKPYLNAGGRHGSGGVGGDDAPAQEQAIFNLALNKKVDLLIHGHEHNYLRSKQLTTSSGCSSITRGSYNAACVVDDGSDAAYTKGAGTVEIINIGAGSKNDGYPYNGASGDAGYFANHVDGTLNGYMLYTVGDTSLTGNLISNTGTTLDTFTIKMPDTTPPVVTWVTPTDQSTVSGTVNLKVSTTDDINGTKICNFYIGSTNDVFSANPTVINSGSSLNLPADASGGCAYNFDTTTVADGVYYLGALANDGSNTGNSSVIKVTIHNSSQPIGDTTAPTVSITAPTANANLSGTATIIASALDNVGVTKVEFYAGSQLLGTSTSSPYSFAWNTASVANGTVSITAKAYDAAGNVATSTAVSVVVNNTGTATPVTSFDLSTTSSTEPEAVSKAVLAINSGTCNSFTTAKTLAASSFTAPSNVVIDGGLSFNIGCSASGGTSAITATLGKRYSDLSKVRVYKVAGSTTTDITSKVTLANTATATTIAYNLTDGSANDEDGTANATIVDPIYVGTVTDSTDSLATTGMNVFTTVIIAVSAVVVGRLMIRKFSYNRY